MATVGQQLKTPEAGWRRYDDTDSRIKYSGTWTIVGTTPSYYNSTNRWTNILTNKVNFKFIGTKLRIISSVNSSGSWSNNTTIKIDGISYNFSYTYATVDMALVFEKTGLTNTTHLIEIINEDGLYIGLDAIDIDSTGYLAHPFLNQVSDRNTMQEGDCIPCRYTATTCGSAGTFSELGACIANEIPITGTPTPDGLFYFIKTDKGTLIADRVIQTGISWDVLNTARFIEGYIPSFTPSNILPIMTSNTTPAPFSVTGTFRAGEDGYQMLDTNNNAYAGIPGAPGYPFTIDLGNTISYVPDHYTLTPYFQYPTYCPVDWKLYGYDGSNWILLDTRTGIQWGDATSKVYTLNSFNKIYHKYQFSCSKSNNNEQFFIGNFSITPVKLPNVLIHSLTGGCAYADANGNKSFTVNSKGGWPTNNEWDKYIINSDLGGKITPGDDNIWHYSLLTNWCKDSSVLGTYTSGSSTSIPTNQYRVTRGYNTIWYNYGHSSSDRIAANVGFRPVLEFIESDSKQTNLWY